MRELVFRPSPDQRVAKLVMGGAFLVAFAALVLHMLSIQPIVADLMFIAAVGCGIFIWARYILSEYTYSVYEDGIFEVKRKQGRRVTVFCSIPLTAITSFQRCLRSTLPKKTYFATQSMLPKEVVLVTARTEKGEETLALEYDDSFFSAVTNAHRTAKNERISEDN